MLYMADWGGDPNQSAKATDAFLEFEIPGRPRMIGVRAVR